MPQNFKQYLANDMDLTARAAFREEQFNMHMLSRALLEDEYEYAELMESDMFNVETGSIKDALSIKSGKNVTYHTPIPHRSDHPDYDKEAAHRQYGRAVRDYDATEAAVTAYKNKHKKNPSKTVYNNLKVYKHDTDPKTAGGILGIIRNYGEADQTPISHEDRKAEAERNFDKFHELRQTNREEYDKQVAAAKARLANAQAPKPLKDTTKGDTISNIPGHRENEKNGHISLGMGGSPDESLHVINSKGDHIIRNACHGKGNCVNACLAKGGCGGFGTTRGRRAVYDQMNSHNESARSDFDLVMHHQLHNMSEQAMAEGKGAVVRPDTTTGNQAFTHAQAINKHFGEDSHKVKSGEGHAVTVNTYGKTYGTKYDTHDMSKNGINITMSDQGPPAGIGHNGEKNVSQKAIQNHEALTRELRVRGGEPTKDGGKTKSRGSFMVFGQGVKLPKTPKGMSDEDYILHARHKNPEMQRRYELVKSAHTVRRYDLSHSTPKEGESWEYHDPKTKSGRVVHNGKSYYYTDHDVAAPMKTTEGKEQPGYMHDNRSGELIDHHKKNPHDHGIVSVAFATSSTNVKKAEPGKSIFYSPDIIDKSGIAHVMHPATAEAAMAREAISKRRVQEQKDVIRKIYGDIKTISKIFLDGTEKEAHTTASLEDQPTQTGVYYDQSFQRRCNP